MSFVNNIYSMKNVNTDSHVDSIFDEEDNPSFNILEWIMRFVKYWYLFVISVLIFMEDPQFRDKSNALLDMPCRNTVDVQSMLQVLTENVDLEALKARVVNPLTGIKVACYYGCIMNRPPELMKFDHHENPMAMDNLMAALGAEVVPFPLKVECCGASFGIPRRDIVMRLSGKLLDSARGFGADALVTACPLCQMNLDMRQGQINDALHEDFKLPVFYYTQLLGYALGLDRATLGFEKLCVDPRLVLGKIKQPAQAR